MARLRNLVYLTHLTLPLLYVLDCVITWRRGQLSSRAILIGLLAAIWLIAGLAAYLFSRNREAFVRRAINPLLTFYCFAITLVAAEAYLRIAHYRSTFYVRPPHLKFQNWAPPGLGPGISSGNKAFSVDDVGLRGPDFPRSGNPYRIITLGGSTTECAAEDDLHEWPHVLMQDLNSSQSSRPVWIGNAGVAGRTAIDHVEYLQHYPVFRKAEMVIIMVGINDLRDALARKGASTDAEIWARSEARLHPRAAPGTFVSRLALWQLVRRSYRSMLPRPPVDEEETFPNFKFRKIRLASKIVPLPDLGLALKEYRGRINAIADACHRLNLRCLFLTQPTMWRADLPEADKDLQWFGWVGNVDSPDGFASLGDLAWAMNA